ncbi:MAG TPA: hypothetical protein PLG90_00390 [Ignavibacteria bacterium]|nr:hypothetical protein [Ignavibacteria bacterium]
MKNLSLIILLFVFAIGCGTKKNETPNQENKSETQTEENKISEQKKSDSTVTSQGTNETSTNDLGMKTGLPSDFPSDVPQPKNGKVIGSLTSSEGTMVTFQTDVTVKDLITFYKTELQKNGFAISDGGESLIQDNGGIIGFVKDKRDVGLMLSSDNGITSLVITYK